MCVDHRHTHVEGKESMHPVVVPQPCASLCSSCHTSGFGPSLSGTFMSLLRVRSLPTCYNYVTPPGAIPPCVLQLCHTSGCGPFLCVGGENRRAGGELRHPGSPESLDLRVSSLRVSGCPVSGSPGLRSSRFLGLWFSGPGGNDDWDPVFALVEG